MAAVDNEKNLRGNNIFVEVDVGVKFMSKNKLALFDTGASISLISNKLLSTLGKVHIIEDGNTLHNASGLAMNTAGKVKLSLGIGNRKYSHTFVITNEEGITAPLILGWDFMRSKQVKIQTNPLLISIEGNIVPTIELNLRHIMQVEREQEVNEEFIENKQVKAYVQEGKIIQAESMGYIELETRIVDFDTGYFEPIAGNAASYTLCPGLVKLEQNKDKTRSRFIIKYINTTNENIEVEPELNLGYIQGCNSSNFTEIEENVVQAVTEETQSQREKRLFQIVDEMIPEDSENNVNLKNLIRKYPQVFSTEEDIPTITPYYFHTIQLESMPKPKTPYPIPACFHDRVKQKLKKMEEHGLIRPSRSSFHSPLVPVISKHNNLRICVDFRNLNNHIVNDYYPLPNINAILQSLGKGKIFSCLDLKQGYHQIPLDEQSKFLTAFTAPGGYYEYNVLPMGLKDAPSSFSRIINLALMPLLENGVQVYMDDIIIYGEDKESHLLNLEKVLNRLSDSKLTIKLNKCSFFQRSVNYLGHIISDEGIKPQHEKVKVIKNIALPNTVKELQSFLGMCNYYRKFIRGFSSIALPLHKLTGGTEKNSKTMVKWTQEAKNAFEKLKEVLSEDIVLQFPDFNKPFYITTDASGTAIGGVLEQESEGILKPLSYFSRKLNPAEQKYSCIERECLSIVYSLRINRQLCLGYPIIIRTDHRPLTWLLTTSIANSRIARWQMSLAEFNIQVEYIEGKSNKVADCLSRLREEIDTYQEDSICALHETSPAIDWNLEEIIRLQNTHEYYGKIKELLRNNSTIDEIKQALKDVEVKREHARMKINEFEIHNDVLYKKGESNYGEQRRQIIVPDEYKNTALNLAHSLPTAGHGGMHVTLARLQKFCYWPGMKEDVNNFCKACLVCRRFKRMGDAPAPLQRYPDVAMPFERVHLDLVGPMGESDNNFKYLFVMIDVLTRFVIAEPLKSKNANEVARVFVNKVICQHGVPKNLVTDQGSEFINAIFKDVADLLGMNHMKTTAYRPQAQGIIERANHSIVAILRGLVEDNLQIWDTMVPLATFAYNSGYQRSIKDSPFYLLYLRDPSFPFDILNKEQKWYNVDNYKQEVACKANRVYDRCQVFLEQAREEVEKNQPKRARIKEIQIGDRVFVKRIPTKGIPKKLQPAYSGPFRVTGKTSDVVIKIRNIKTGAVKTVHTDRVRVIHEDNANRELNLNVRRAYPVHEEDNTDTPHDDDDTGNINPFPFPQNTDDIVEFANQPRHYNLRSNSRPLELPNIMPRPIEYDKTLRLQ